LEEKKSYPHKKNIILMICFFIIIALCIYFLYKYRVINNNINLLSERIKYYMFPIVFISGTTLILLLANYFLGLGTIENNIIKWILRISLIIIGLWYFLIINNFFGPISLPDIIATNSVLSFEVFIKIENLFHYQGVLCLELYGICLYFSIT
jgi:hypothetical protein